MTTCDLTQPYWEVSDVVDALRLRTNDLEYAKGFADGIGGFVWGPFQQLVLDTDARQE